MNTRYGDFTQVSDTTSFIGGDEEIDNSKRCTVNEDINKFITERKIEKN